MPRRDGSPAGPRAASKAAGWLVAVTVLTLGSSANASLGRSSTSVDEDRVHMSARMASARLTTHTVKTLTLANGAVVREFMGANGVVFAVSWRGPGRPDLHQLLGDRFDVLQSDNTTASGRRTRLPLAVNRSDFVVHTGGHPGAFWGYAYIPQQIPGGFSGKDLQ